MNFSLSHHARVFAVSFLVIANLTVILAQVEIRIPGVAGQLRQQRNRSNNQAGPTILERNVRAELEFLASDAMQGRGSASGYERIAAEYISSQFRQFGLEPAGDADSAGNIGFVQRVPLETLKFAEAPVLSASSGSETRKWQYGRDFLASFVRATRTIGGLQVMDVDGTPAKGAVMAIRLPEGVNQQTRQELIRKARMAQAAAIVMPESDASRKVRESGEAKVPTLPGRIQGEASPDESFVSIALRKDAFDQLAAMPAGTLVEFSGATQPSETGATWNAVGVLRGSDPTAASEAIFLSAHLDHLGVGDPVNGDAIYNGADDDASGCVAVLELARALASGQRPRRTIYFICFGSEERGGYGAKYFVAHSPVPLPQVVADVTFEMIGRPDAKVAANTLWLTGFERSTLGPELVRQGAQLVADPHPEQNFFQRSDNYTLALRGVVAHTVSSFGLHTDYHRPSDELAKIDLPFMTSSIGSMIVPIRWLADSPFRPTWVPGGAPK
jgi:Peptidase family M28